MGTSVGSSRVYEEGLVLEERGKEFSITKVTENTIKEIKRNMEIVVQRKRTKT